MDVDVVCDWQIKNEVHLRDITIIREERDDDEMPILPKRKVFLQGKDNTPCEFKISARSPGQGLVAVDILCNARLMEVYGEKREYIMTEAGTFVGAVEEPSGNTTTDLRLYLLQKNFPVPVNNFSFRLMSLQKKQELCVHLLQVSYVRLAPEFPPLGTNAPGCMINMAKVHEIIKDVSQPLGPGAQRLMKTIEEFQKTHGSNIPLTSPAKPIKIRDIQDDGSVASSSLASVHSDSAREKREHSTGRDPSQKVVQIQAPAAAGREAWIMDNRRKGEADHDRWPVADKRCTFRCVTDHSESSPSTSSMLEGYGNQICGLRRDRRSLCREKHATPYSSDMDGIPRDNREHRADRSPKRSGPVPKGIIREIPFEVVEKNGSPCKGSHSPSRSSNSPNRVSHTKDKSIQVQTERRKSPQRLSFYEEIPSQPILRRDRSPLPAFYKREAASLGSVGKEDGFKFMPGYVESGRARKEFESDRAVQCKIEDRKDATVTWPVSRKSTRDCSTSTTCLETAKAKKMGKNDEKNNKACGKDKKADFEEEASTRDECGSSWESESCQDEENMSLSLNGYATEEYGRIFTGRKSSLDEEWLKRNKESPAKEKHRGHTPARGVQKHHSRRGSLEDTLRKPNSQSLSVKENERKSRGRKEEDPMKTSTVKAVRDGLEKRCFGDANGHETDYISYAALRNGLEGREGHIPSRTDPVEIFESEQSRGHKTKGKKTTSTQVKEASWPNNEQKNVESLEDDVSKNREANVKRVNAATSTNRSEMPGALAELQDVFAVQLAAVEERLADRMADMLQILEDRIEQKFKQVINEATANVVPEESKIEVDKISLD